MANVHDVAAYVLARAGQMSTMKLQKLVYYCQAWHLVWDEQPLFPERIEAWANGPVVRALFDRHRGRFSVDAWPSGDPSRLTPAERETIDIVISDCAGLSGRQLGHLAHSERPWREARVGLGPTDRSSNEITPEALQDYYSGVAADESATAVTELDWAAWEAAA
jgi:uncharacterized phage-associated protein